MAAAPCRQSSDPMTVYDLAIVGAGPAGMGAAIEASAAGLSVVVLDEQTAPGGQVHRAIEQRAKSSDDDRAGAALVAAFRASKAVYRPATSVWQVEHDTDGVTLHVSHSGKARAVRARRLLIATGAMERSVSIPGWTLPGVMTVGAAQILLKTGGNVPSGRVVIAGQGPLPLLYMTQLLKAGVRPAAYLDTTHAGAFRRAWPHLGGALRNASQLIKGLRFMLAVRRAGIPVISGFEAVEAIGKERVTSVRYRARGQTHELTADLVLLHEGVVPQFHFAMALGVEHRWDDRQFCWRPVLDADGQTSVPHVSIAGDCAGIGGWLIAEASGRLAGLAAAAALGRTVSVASVEALRATRNRLSRLRPFLDAWYQPRSALLNPPDNVIVCRCEEKTAGDLREAIRLGSTGPNQVKTATRCGMGPCQGRLCGLTLTTVLAAEKGVSPQEIGALRIRPPLKPLTLGELASQTKIVS
ncbi:MAG: NAD(P)/FAD-dependent oxidoreductase [Beijerinckiaceae bacterium]